MPVVKFVSHDGVVHEVDAAAGSSVMQAAMDNGIEGIVAECGGACSCATCHCYVDESWYDKITPPHANEKDMLEWVLEGRPTSRLSCQITLDDSMDGIVINLPESQS